MIENQPEHTKRSGDGNAHGEHTEENNDSRTNHPAAP